MIEKETEDFFEKMLTEEEDIEASYIQALSDWDKELFKFQLPSFICRHKDCAKETAQLQKINQSCVR